MPGAPKLRHNVGGSSTKSTRTGPFTDLKTGKTYSASGKLLSTRKKSSYKPSKEFNKEMKKYQTANVQKRIMTFNNYLNGPGSSGYLQDIPAVGLTTSGLTNNALSVVVLQTGRQLTQLNAGINTTTGATVCVPLDGYSVLTGDTTNRLMGSYAKITSTYMNMNITMDPTKVANSYESTLDTMLPHQFRIIQVKARRDKMVSPGAQVASYGVPSLATNLFRDEAGEATGILTDSATQDMFTWFVNKQFWTVLKDERFTLACPTLSYISPSPAGEQFQVPTNVSQHKSSRFKKYWLPKPSTKVRFETNVVGGVIKEEVVDYNYVVHTIILCKNTSSGERASNHWNVQVNGATQFINN